mgnify:CR=1 FL=1
MHAYLAAAGSSSPIPFDRRDKQHYQMAEQKDVPIKRVVDEMFSDAESKSNLVGLYSLLLKIDRRINSRAYEKSPATKGAEELQ